VSTEERPLRVLIADDHAATRDDVRRALERDERFLVCAEVADAAGAVQASVREQPDLCLLDVRMPGSGLAAAWEIRSRLPATRIVMLTVSDAESDLFAALRAGADSYLVKTVDLRAVPEALLEVSRGRAAIPPELVTAMVSRFRAREPRHRPLAHDGLSESGRRLTSREWEVLELLAQDRSTLEIARELVLSPSAVRAHITAIVRKLGVRDRADAIARFRSQS
jgi:DNA-binding NarL/FixJ family response regulator